MATTCLLKFRWSFAAHWAISLASCVGNEMVLRVVPCITVVFLPPAVRRLQEKDAIIFWSRIWTWYLSVKTPAQTDAAGPSPRARFG